MSVLRSVAVSLALVLAACSPPGPFTLLDADSARDGRQPAAQTAGDAREALTPTTPAATANREGGAPIDTGHSVLPRRDSLYAPLTAAEQAWIDRTMASLDVRAKVAQMVSVWVLGDFTNAAAPAYAAIERSVREDGIGGVIMSLGSPIEVAAKVNSLQLAAISRDPAIPLLVSSDLEPGLGRLEGGVFVPSLTPSGSATVLPSNMAIGATRSEANARSAGEVTGREALATGIHQVYAPVADVNNNPANPVINVRSFGEDPVAVGGLVAAFVEGVQGAGAMATVKHFPGHGDTDTDSHHALPIVPSSRARLDSVELVPFRRAVQARVASVMSAHIALPAVHDSRTPATLAPEIMTGLLRDTLGFQGLAVTDALTMEGIGRGYSAEESAVLSVKAGTDVLLMPRDVRRTINAVVAAVQRGEITEARLDASVRRLLEWKVRTNAVAQPITSLETTREVVAAPRHEAVARRIAEQSLTLIRDEPSLVPLATGANRRVVSIVYAPDAEIGAGRTMLPALRASRTVVSHRISPETPAARLNEIAAGITSNDVVVVSTHVRRVEGEGRTALPARIGNWINSLAGSQRVVVVAFGNPYVIRQFPRATSYMVTYSLSPASEAAAARALLGQSPITGRSPVSLPGTFQLGAGIQRGTR